MADVPVVGGLNLDLNLTLQVSCGAVGGVASEEAGQWVAVLDAVHLASP